MAPTDDSLTGWLHVVSYPNGQKNDGIPYSVPKHVKIFREDLQIAHTGWYGADEFEVGLPAGKYAVQLSILARETALHVVNITAGRRTEANIPFEFSNQDIYHLQLQHDINGGYAHLMGSYYDNVTSDLPQGTVAMWNVANGRGSVHQRVRVSRTEINQVSRMLMVYSRDMPFCQVTPVNGHPIIKCLPPNHHLTIELKQVTSRRGAYQPIEIDVTSGNYRYETLLRLLSQGSMAEARSLVNLDMAELAMYMKMEDPAGAALAGYFLLRVNALERLHDWATNLADWFPWLPDGSIIHAWQMIQKGVDKPEDIGIIARRLIEALARGVPIYSEGLRLLYEGLIMLHPLSSEIAKVREEALQLTRLYMENADTTQCYTTFKGTTPFEPGYEAPGHSQRVLFDERGKLLRR